MLKVNNLNCIALKRKELCSIWRLQCVSIMCTSEVIKVKKLHKDFVYTLLYLETGNTSFMATSDLTLPYFSDSIKISAISHHRLLDQFMKLKPVPRQMQLI
jgi:hypothetical protein